MTSNDRHTGEIIMYQPDETVRLEVRVENETVWLSQQQMADLFGTGRQAITKHLQNIYECKELEKEATSSILELVRKEGTRNARGTTTDSSSSTTRSISSEPASKTQARSSSPTSGCRKRKPQSC